MNEGKKKSPKAEPDERSEDALKSVKRVRTRISSEKQIEDELLPESLSDDEELKITAEQETGMKIEPAGSGEAVATGDEGVTATEQETVSDNHEKTDESEIRDAGEQDVSSKPAKTRMAEDFDWDAFEREELRTSPKYAEYEALYDKTLSTVAVDEVVTGTVIQMTSREVVVNIGYKSEGVVSLNEFRYNPNLKVGDTVEVYVESQEDKKGQLVLSHKKARAINSWDRVNASLEKDEIITG
jgi:polyribonucleotide nucleotidyltransferase